MAVCDPNGEHPVAPVFSPYDKMPTNTNCWTSGQLDAIKKWVALEKIHGANFSFTVGAEEGKNGPARAAKRSGFLKPGENFFRLQKNPTLVKDGGEKARRLFENVRETYFTDASSVAVFGELFGGYYPHSDVPRVPNAVTVQGEVVYCPELRFIAYDVAVTHGDHREFLDYDVCMQLFQSVGFLYCEPLLTGTLQDMLRLELGFETKLPAKFGLPPLQDRKNVAEGVVIKPLKNVVLDTSKGPQRVIFKRKVEHFEERRKQRSPVSSGAGKARSKKGGRKGRDYEHEANLKLLQYEMSALVSEQRIVNTISKRGIPESYTEWTGLAEALVWDVLESTEHENKDLWESCGGSSGGIESLMGGLREECTQMVDEYRLHNSMAKATLS